MSNNTTTTNLKLYFRLLKYIHNYWWAFVLGIIGTILFAGFDAYFAYLLKPILNQGFIARKMNFIHLLPFLIIALFVLRSLSSFVSNYFMSYVSRGIVLTFRKQIFSRLMKLPASYYDQTSSGKLLSIILFNVEQVADATADALIELVHSFFLISGLLVVMFMMSWQLSLLNLAIMPLVILSINWSSRRMRRISSNIQVQMGEITNIAEESIEGYKVVRAFNGEAYETKKFNTALETNRARELKIVATKSISVSFVQFMASIVLATIVYLATHPNKMTSISAGEFISFISAMLMLLKPLKIFSTVNGKIQRGLAGVEGIFALLDEPVEEDHGTISVKRVKGDIAYKHVSFAYTNKANAPVLHDINFTLEAGKKIALVGFSGGGKTTLVTILQRFYDGFSGEITIDGINIKDYRLTDLRKQFAVVSQNVTLFNDTIAHNIAYGSFANVSETEIIAAAKAANAWEFIEQLPLGINTLVGENGVLLSGGQRQRIAIARAILKDAPILILDEATSALDTFAERQIQMALENLAHNRTTLVIAHRLSTIESSDLILVLDHGQIVERGHHTELLAHGGLYAKLCNLQFKDSE